MRAKLINNKRREFQIAAVALARLNVIFTESAVVVIDMVALKTKKII